jgi:small-conductance mechanosensitive channel
MLAEIDWNILILDPIRQMFTRIMAYLPVLLGALIILIVGWIIAKSIKKLVSWLLKAVHFDTLADRSGMSEILRKGDLDISARDLVSNIVYWLIIVMVLVMTVDALGLPGFLTRLGKHREQDRGQYRNNCDDHEQLDQGKTTFHNKLLFENDNSTPGTLPP